MTLSTRDEEQRQIVHRSVTFEDSATVTLSDISDSGISGTPTEEKAERLRAAMEALLQVQQEDLDIVKELPSYFRLSSGGKVLLDYVRERMEQGPTLAIFVFLAAHQHARILPEDKSDRAKEFENMAMKKLCTDLDSFVLKNPLLRLLDAGQLAQLLDNIDADDYTFFCILKQWSKPEHREEIGHLLQHYVHLDRISPILLGTKVRNSGLVSDSQLVDAFVQQANRGAAVNERQVPCVWRSTKTNTFAHDSDDCYGTDSIVGRILTPGGSYTWSFRISEMNADTWLMMGIADSTRLPVAGPYVGRQRNSWSFGNNGKRFCSGRCKSMPLFDMKENDIVTFTLTLRDDYRMDVVRNGDNAVVLFSGDKLKGIDESGVVPTISIYGKSSVRFLGYE